VPVEAQIERGRRLVAVTVDDGHVAWEVGTGIGSRGPAGNAPESDFFADLVEFQGPPAPIESQLYLIAERSDALHLVVLEGATGKILWTTKLGAIDAALGRDDRRRVQHCRPTFVGGLAICPTGAGGVIAVDRLGRTVRWAWRYPREPIRVRPMDELPETNRLPQVLWPRGWRDLTVVASGEARLLLASPESDVLWALDPSTGRLAWQQPRGDGMYLAGADVDRALVAGRHSVRAYDALGGTLLWNTPVEEPVGRGFATPTHYVLPIRSGGVAAVDLATGSLRQTFPQRGAPPWLEFGAAGAA
jgi:outer membrane protein assembly factor BamB